MYSSVVNENVECASDEDKVDVEAVGLRSVTIKKPATNMDVSEQADVDETVTQTVKSRKRSERRNKILVYYT